MSADTGRSLEVDVRARLLDFELVAQAAIELKGVTGLFGPSGSGKSTLLRVIAGFLRSATGVVRMADRTWLDSSAAINLAANRRPVGYVFQDARLFEHLDVAGNLRFAEQRNRNGGPSFDEVATALDLAPLMQREVTGLSGGERQRVALGRTLLCKPELLLLDEPLAGLDAARKNDILPYFETLQERFSLPTIYVSHSVDEIVRLADKVLVLDAGRIRAHGDTQVVLNAMDLAGSGSGVSASSVLKAQVTRQLPQLCLTELLLGEQPFFIPERPDLVAGKRLLVRIRAGDVAIATTEPRDISIRNVLAGTLEKIESDASSAFAMVHVKIGDALLRCQLTRQSVMELNLSPGLAVYALVKTASFEAHR